MDLLKKIGKSLLLGTLIGLAIALFTNFFLRDLIDFLEYQTYYMRYRWQFDSSSESPEANAPKSDNGIYIIDIDDRSQQKLGLYYNWTRAYHADLLHALKKHYPAAAVFDVNFFDPEDNNHAQRLNLLLQRSIDRNRSISLPDNLRQSILSTIDYDKQFIDATRECGFVIHGLRMSQEADYPDYALSQVKNKMSMAWHDSLHPSSTLQLSDSLSKSGIPAKSIIDGIFAPLAHAALDIGYVNMEPNKDGIIRSIPLAYRFGKNKILYLPLSVRTAATLFGTPNSEIIYKPKQYLDIGRPFKIFKDSTDRMRFSYPNVTAAQMKAIFDAAPQILALQPGSSYEVSAYCTINRDTTGAPSIEMHTGSFSSELVSLFFKSDLSTALNLPIGQSINFAPDIAIKRDSDVDWVLTAPFGDTEWWLSRLDLVTLANVHEIDFADLLPDSTRLLFHSFTVTNRDGKLMSSLPVLRDEALREICATKWSNIQALKPGTRMEFGKPVRIPLDEMNQHIITYFGPRAKPFPYYSYYDIMTDRVKGGLEGKIFIIGSTVPSMFDIVSVPHSPNYPGVEVHASLLNSFLTNTFMVRLETWQNFLILLLTGIIIGFISYMLKPTIGGIIAAVSVLLYFLIAMMVFSDNLWIDIARPILTIIMTYTIVMAYRYVTEEKDRKFLQSTFKHYLSPELIDQMYRHKSHPQLGGEEGIRTAYFTDIQGFSTFSEKLGSPTRLVELLNEYLTEMTDTLLARFGTLDKYEGDAIIAFFGAPMPMEDHAKQACLTALDMQKKLGILRDKWKSEGDKWPTIVHEMRMRIGINTGAITTGNMGSATRMNYTMMGDAVNLAARLESAAKQYGVYTMISQATYDFVKDDFIVRQVDKITVVGKSEPVTVYELICEKGKETPELRALLDIYNKGLANYYNQQWDQAIELMQQAHAMEPFREIAPKKMTPSRMIVGYAQMYKDEPPPTGWDGVNALTDK